MKKKRWSSGRIVALIACWLLPVLTLLFGVVVTLDGQRITAAPVVLYGILPLLSGGLCFLTLRSRKRAWVKSLLCIGIQILFAVHILIVSFWGIFQFFYVYEQEELAENYVPIAAENTALPELDAVGQPVEITGYECAATMAIFTEQTVWLKCRYEAEEYTRQKAWIEGNYRFITEPLSDGSYTVQPEITVDGYRFRLFLAGDLERIYYPKELPMVATNDTTREILYLYYWDWDLDYIASLEEHIRNNCGFDLVRG